MNYSNILIPTDGSDFCHEIIDFFCKINPITKATIHVVYVIEVPRSLPLGTKIPEKDTIAQQALDKAKEIADCYKTEISPMLIYARTIEDSILSTSEDLRCDLIAIASGVQKFRFLSNYAMNVFQRTKSNVMLIKNSQK